MATRKDIEIIRTDSYTHVLEFTEDQSAYTFTATLTDGTNTVSFNVTETSSTEITLSLTTAQTTALDADGTTQYKWRAIRTLDTETTTVAAGRAVVIDI